MSLLQQSTVIKAIFSLLPILVVGASQPASAQIIGSGSTSGSFGNLNSNDPIIFPNIDGVGTSQLNFFYPDTSNNFLQFEGANFQNVQRETPFLLGTLSFKNGNGFQGIPGTFIVGSSVTYTSELTISSSSSTTTPYNFNQSFTEPITLVVTPNFRVGDNGQIFLVTDEQAADILYFPNRPELGSFRIFEDQTGTVELLGSFGSFFLTGFGNAISGGFLNPTIRSIPDVPPVTVPEPMPILGLASLGFVALGSVLKNNHNKKKLRQKIV